MDYGMLVAALRAARRSAAADLRHRGLTYRAIARRLGVATSTTHADLRRTAGPDQPDRLREEMSR